MIRFIWLSCVIGALRAQHFPQPAIYQITDPVDHAEGPSWDGRKNILYYVDIHTGTVLSYHWNSGNLHSIILDGEVTPVIPSKNNENILIVGLNRDLVAVEWDGSGTRGNQKILCTVSAQYPQSRFNDGKADLHGRLWIGTMGSENTSTGALVPNEGVLYKIVKQNFHEPTVEIAPVNISNGLAWNAANDKFYYIDSPTKQVVEYDFDLKDGTIHNRRVVFDVEKHVDLVGDPDGMTIDKDDNLWVALYGGGSVIQIDPQTGELLKRIALPARDVTSAMWGGPNLDVLFVTTSRVSLTDAERRFWPSAGSVFAIENLGTKGKHVNNVDLVDWI